VSEETGARETEEFAALLRGLKDRSGLSYGVLATRLHMSTSTLHRYCNGTAVPNDYAPVERLARVCRATPQELIQLHRRWVLADAARGLRVSTQRRGGPGQSARATPPRSRPRRGTRLRGPARTSPMPRPVRRSRRIPDRRRTRRMSRSSSTWREAPCPQGGVVTH